MIEDSDLDAQETARKGRTVGKIVVTAFVTLDGVIQAPGFQQEDQEGGFELGGWTQPYGDEIADQAVTESVLAADALLLGRKAYERLSSFWPGADPADPRTGKLNDQPKYVVSRTLSEVGWNNTTILSGPVAEEVAALKQRYDEISIWGSSELIAELMRHELVDEFLLLTYPVVVGSGKRLFNGDTPVALELARSITSSTGVIISTYRRTASSFLSERRPHGDR